MAAVSLGTETDGSILCPADYNSVVGIKPTVGLTSRAGVIPISPRQDTIGYENLKSCSVSCNVLENFDRKLLLNLTGPYAGQFQMLFMCLML